MTFEPDEKLQKVAEAYAQDAIDFVRAHYTKQLDWTDDSIQIIEAVAGHLHDTLPDPRPSEKEIYGLGKMLGSYVGEVFRKNHGAMWGIVSLGGNKMPGLKSSHDGTTFWPWGRVRNRLVNGPEDNIWHYYQTLLSEHAARARPVRKRWWKAFFCVALVLFAFSCGFQQEHYETAAQARLAGAQQRGLLPPFIPDTASNVHMVNDTDTRGVWVWCNLDPQTQAQLKANVRAVGWSEARANTRVPPFSFNFPTWNPILGGVLTYTPAAGSLYFVAGPGDEWHGIADPSGRCWITRH